MPTFYVIPPPFVAEFTVLVAPHEMIKPVFIPPASGFFSNKFILQEDIDQAGPRYAAEVAKPYWANATKQTGTHTP